MLAAVILWAFERHLDGRRTTRSCLGVARGAAAPRGVAVPGRSTGCGCGSTSRERAAARLLRLLVPALLVPAGVVGGAQPVPRRRARQRAEPGQRRLRRAPGVGAVQALRGEHGRAGRGWAAVRASAWRPSAWMRTPRAGRRARARGARLLVVRARGRDDRGGLLRQPALPDGHDRRRVACSAAWARCASSRASGAGDALARQRRARAARGRGRARRRRPDRLADDRRQGRQHRPRAGRASSTRRTCGTT